MATRKQYTQLDVVNQALTALGEGVISNLDTDQSTAAIIMRQNYDPVREACLTMSAWRFATTKKALSKLSAAPLNRWSSAWQLPTDMLKVLYVWPPGNYEIQGQRLYTNRSSDVELDYIRVIEEAYWLPWFTRLVVAELVLRTCKGITGDDPSTAMIDERRDARAEAFFQDAQQQPNQTVLPNDFIDVRY